MPPAGGAAPDVELRQLPQRDGAWIRFALLEATATTANATDDDFDTPVAFQVKWGRGNPPRSNRTCK